MKRYSKELIIGLSVLIAALVLVFGIDYLKGINVFKAANYYYVSYENVNGLTVSSPVTINGYKVGQVRDIAYEYDNPGHVLVEISLDKQPKVPSGSKAVIQNRRQTDRRKRTIYDGQHQPATYALCGRNIPESRLSAYIGQQTRRRLGNTHVDKTP